MLLFCKGFEKIAGFESIGKNLGRGVTKSVHEYFKSPEFVDAVVDRLQNPKIQAAIRSTSQQAGAAATTGIKKQWLNYAKKAVPYAAGLGIAGGTGAVLGHGQKLQDRIDALRSGTNPDPESLVQKHPHIFGAMSLGALPYFSRKSQEQDRLMTARTRLNASVLAHLAKRKGGR